MKYGACKESSMPKSLNLFPIAFAVSLQSIYPFPKEYSKISSPCAFTHAGDSIVDLCPFA